MMIRTRKTSLMARVAAIIALSLGLTACGGNDDEGTDEPTPIATVQPTVQPSIRPVLTPKPTDYHILSESGHLNNLKLVDGTYSCIEGKFLLLEVGDKKNFDGSTIELRDDDGVGLALVLGGSLNFAYQSGLVSDGELDDDTPFDLPSYLSWNDERETITFHFSDEDWGVKLGDAKMLIC